MITLIRNEFYKQKREWSFLFLLLLSLLPVLTGGAGAIFNSSTKTLADLFFFMNNQFAMFFPMVLFILVGFLFYQEYKNKTYINWITYGYSKRKLFFTKVSVALIIGVLFAAILLLLFICLIFALKVTGKVSADIPELLTVSVGFLLEAAIIIPVTVCAGAIIINLSRNIIISTTSHTMTDFKAQRGKRRYWGSGYLGRTKGGRWNGRYMVTWPDGTKRTRDIYADSEDECEKLLAVVITEMKTEVAAERERLRAENRAS